MDTLQFDDVMFSIYCWQKSSSDVIFIFCVDPPKDNGGDEITGYILQMDDGGGNSISFIYLFLCYAAGL